MTLFLHELRGQLRLYWRSRELAFFTFLLPIVMFVLLGSVYGDEVIENEGVRAASYLLAGMLGYGAISVGFAGIAIMLVIRRESGILKRLRATPLPAWAYVAGVLTATLVAFAIEAACLIGLGRLLFDTDLPQRVFSLVLALLLAAVAFTALGLAMTTVVRSAEGSSAMINAIYLPLSFISGAFFSPDDFPGILRAVAEVLPLIHVIDLTQYVLFKGAEIWDRPGDVAIVAAWGIFGALVAIRGFRWMPREG